MNITRVREDHFTMLEGPKRHTNFNECSKQKGCKICEAIASKSERRNRQICNYSWRLQRLSSVIDKTASQKYQREYRRIQHRQPVGSNQL